MPHHHNHYAWLAKSIEYRVTALATPKDLNNTSKVDGFTVKDIAAGYNIDTLGALGNHKAYPHPDYMASPLRHTIEGSEFLALGNQVIPEANKFNCALIYRNFVDYKWPNTGTIYQKDGSISWPIDIETDRRFEFLTFGIIDAGAVFLGYDDLASVHGKYWEEKHTANAVEMHLTYFTAASAYLLHWLVYQGVSFR